MPVKRTQPEEAKEKGREPTFSKEQIVSSERYSENRDLVEALLDEKKKYTFETVDNMIEKYMKGKVK